MEHWDWHVSQCWPVSYLLLYHLELIYKSTSVQVTGISNSNVFSWYSQRKFNDLSSSFWLDKFIMSCSLHNIPTCLFEVIITSTSRWYTFLTSVFQRTTNTHVIESYHLMSSEWSVIRHPHIFVCCFVFLENNRILTVIYRWAQIWTKY